MFNLNSLTAEQRLSKAVVAIMHNPRYVALAGILMIGNRSVVEAPTKPGMPATAWTNGKDEFYVRSFVEKLTDPELRFLILHESYHKLYRHLTTWEHLWKEDADRANKACDFVINVKIADDNSDNFATMTGELVHGCYNTKYRGWDSAAVYRDLPASTGGGGGGGGGQPFDGHDWDAAEEMSAEEKHELARELDQAIRQGALMAGKMGTGGDRAFEELLDAQVDWREAMREFVTSVCAGRDYSTWQKPNRRYIGAGIYMPSGISEQIGDIVVAPDMSGSIGQREVTAMLSEVRDIAETVHPESVRVLYWDTQVCQDEEYKGPDVADLINSTKPAGGGGTTVSCVTHYMREKQINPQCAIVLTDGHLGGDHGNWTCPVLWVVLDNKSFVPATGTVLHITAAQM